MQHDFSNGTDKEYENLTLDVSLLTDIRCGGPTE